MSAKAFQDRLSVAVLPETPILDVSYDSTNPRLARSVISEIARIYPREIDRTLGTRTPGEPRPANSFDLVVRQYDEPHVQADTVGGTVGTSAIFAAVAGLALGLLLAVAREALDSRLHDRKDAEDWFGAPVVGTLPKGMNGRPPPGLGSDGSSASYDRRTASLDLLLARLQFAHAGVQGPTILVAEAGPAMGKSTVAANLSAALARGGKHVICVDADLRRPRLHRSLGLQLDGPGVLEVLNSHATFDDALVPVELTQPETNGSTPPEPTGRLEALLGSESHSGQVDSLTPDQVEFLIEHLQKRADFVIFDSPPLVVADAYPLAVQANNVLVVARHGRATKDQAEAVRATLRELGVDKVGVVLTDAPSVSA
jgi:polysaccharide biosynthesis transport protein